jgi:neutral amino acid transport system permease protein
VDYASPLFDAVRTAVGPTCAAYALAAIGLNLQFGYAGLLNLGFVASMALGAYGLAITVTLGGTLLLGFAVGVVASALFALLVALPTVRLRADYLAMTTLAAAEILRLVLRSSIAKPLTGGVYGLQRFANDFYALNPFGSANYAIGPVIFSGRTLWLMVVAWIVVIVAALVVWLITASPWGRVLTALREDEDLVRSLGKNAFLAKLQVMVIGGVLGAFAGMVLAVDQQNVNPDNFMSTVTFYLFAIVILGGRGRVVTPILGSILFWLIMSGTDGVLRKIVDATAGTGGWFGQDQVGATRNILVGLALIGVIVFRPQGLLTFRSRKTDTTLRIKPRRMDTTV